MKERESIPVFLRKPISVTKVGITLAGRWWSDTEHWLGSFVIYKGVQSNILKDIYSFVLFHGGGGGQDPSFYSSESPHEYTSKDYEQYNTQLIYPIIYPPCLRFLYSETMILV